MIKLIYESKNYKVFHLPCREFRFYKRQAYFFDNWDFIVSTQSIEELIHWLKGKGFRYGLKIAKQLKAKGYRGA